MSATLYYRPIKRSRPHLGCAAPNRFSELVARRMGNGPEWEFGPTDLDWLRGMVDAGCGIDDTIDELIRLIEKHGPIVVSKEY